MKSHHIFVVVSVLFLSHSTSWALRGLSQHNKPMLRAEQWLSQESQIAKNKIRNAISPMGTARGVVIASPQRSGPDYYRHWVRDGALTMDVVLQLSIRAMSQGEQAYWEGLLRDYAKFSRQNQNSRTLAGLGEPIFEINGEPFLGPWGRPQNDGPALRAIALGLWAEKLLDRGEVEFVKSLLYSAVLPAETVVKADLEYVSNHWQDSSFDLWEEIRGHHFFTAMVQRKALLVGAHLAQRMQDPAAAHWYLSQARAMEPAISEHARGRGWIIPTTHWAEGVDYKKSDMDTAVILGVLRGSADGFFSVRDQRVVQTVQALIDVFQDLYPINKQGVTAPALGRYPEDLYAGADFNGGNPWVLTTLAAAEYLYQVAATLPASQLALATKLLSQGDAFVQRVQYHANGDGSLSEQIRRDNGFMTSARDLTWNYSAILTTQWAREQAIRKFRFK